MNDKEKELFFKEFNNGLHMIGRIMLILAIILLVGVPFVVGTVNGVSPDWSAFLKGLMKIGIIYIPVLQILLVRSSTVLVHITKHIKSVISTL